MSEIEKFGTEGFGGADRFPQPSWATRAGQIDRAHEGDHVVRMRDFRREMKEAVADQATRLVRYVATVDAKAKALTETKFHLQRAQKESQILDCDDAELRAKFGLLDDDYFLSMRIDFQNWK